MMLVRLIRDARIMHKAGETVDVSPDAYNFLVSTGSAEAVKKADSKPAEKPKRTKK